MKKEEALAGYREVIEGFQKLATRVYELNKHGYLPEDEYYNLKNRIDTEIRSNDQILFNKSQIDEGIYVGYFERNDSGIREWINGEKNLIRSLGEKIDRLAYKYGKR